MVAEVLPFDDELRRLIQNQCASAEMLEAARRIGFKTMLDNARYLVDKGLTSIEEAERVVGPLAPAADELLLTGVVDA